MRLRRKTPTLTPVYVAPPTPDWATYGAVDRAAELALPPCPACGSPAKRWVFTFDEPFKAKYECSAKCWIANPERYLTAVKPEVAA